MTTELHIVERTVPGGYKVVTTTDDDLYAIDTAREHSLNVNVEYVDILLDDPITVSRFSRVARFRAGQKV